jgi:hypothetical protein
MASSQKLLERVPAGLPGCSDDEHFHEIPLSLSCTERSPSQASRSSFGSHGFDCHWIGDRAILVSLLVPSRQAVP